MRYFLRLAAACALLFSIVLSTVAQSRGYDKSRMDTSVEACDDFYQYANGTWLKNTKIPAEYPSWGSFLIVYENNQNVLKQVVENAAKQTNAPKGSDAQLVGDYYASCMNEAAIEKAGTAPIQPFLQEVGKVKTTKDLQREIAEMHNRGIGGFFRFGIGADEKNSNAYLANASQGGVGLPNRDYWFNTDAKSAETRQKYMEFVTNMFKLAGDSPEKAAAEAQTIATIQKRMAGASKPPVELRDPEANYNKKTLAELAQMTPNFSWTDYFAARGVSNIKEINVGQPKYFEELSKMLKDVSLDDWKTYLRWVVILDSSSQLPKAFRDENFNFYGKYLFGTQQQEARWKICTQEVDNVLGESLGQEFVKTSFTPEAKKRMNELIDNLFAAYKERIQKLDWMSDATKQRALEKLAAYTRKIGYPDKLKGYKGLNISRDSYFQNNLLASQFEIKRNLERASKPTVDKTEWGMTPPTVNAYNNAQFNEIVFPAGILQPPFYDPTAVDALNYGGIGAVIGHEITHGFDDQGSKFDAQGNLKSWWTDADRKAFDERTNCVANQFSKYKVGGDVFMNGKLTLGENTADLGGLTMAFAAFKKSMQGKPAAKIDGFTPEQMFFLGWAQVWAEVSTPEGEAWQAQNDPHAVARFRVNGPLSNMPEFAQAFSCKANSPMVRTDICNIW